MSDARKRKKAYYAASGKSKKPRMSFQLDAGMQGFLITCNNTEKQAVREAYNVFNEYADAMYGCEKGNEDEKNDQTEEDFESAIRNEVDAMKSESVEARRFQVVETKANNCIFVRTTLEHPEDLVTRIFTDACNSHKSKSRFILKLFPVLGTCRAAEDKIEKLAEDVLPPYLTGLHGSTYCLLFKVRCNNTMDRDTIIQLVACVVSRINPAMKVKFDDPDLVISIDVLQKVCCLSVMKDFNKFKKYNLQEAANAKVAAKATATGDDAQPPATGDDSIAGSDVQPPVTDHSGSVAGGLEAQKQDDQHSQPLECGKPESESSESPDSKAEASPSSPGGAPFTRKLNEDPNSCSESSFTPKQDETEVEKNLEVGPTGSPAEGASRE